VLVNVVENNIGGSKNVWGLCTARAIDLSVLYEASSACTAGESSMDWGLW